MFQDFEKHYFKEGEEEEASNTDAVQKKCNHILYSISDGTFCQRCLLQFSTNEMEESFVSKPSNGGIRKEIDFLNLSNDIVDLTNDLFLQTCEKRIHRGQFRKSIICACLFHAFLLRKCPQSFDVVMKWFKLNNHFANKGFNLVKLKNSSIRFLYENYIDTATMMMRRLNMKPDEMFYQFLNRQQIKDYVESKNMKRMHVAVACLIFVYIQQSLKKEMNLHDFCNMTQSNLVAVDRMLKMIRYEIDF